MAENVKMGWLKCNRLIERAYHYTDRDLGSVLGRRTACFVRSQTGDVGDGVGDVALVHCATEQRRG